MTEPSAFCDRCHSFVAASDTQPYGDSIYRICSACIAADKAAAAAWDALRAQGLSEGELRAAAGDR